MFVSCDKPSVNIEVGTHEGIEPQASEHAGAQYISLLTKGFEGLANIKAYIVPHRNDDELQARLKDLRNYTAHMLD